MVNETMQCSAQCEVSSAPSLLSCVSLRPPSGLSGVPALALWWGYQCFLSPPYPTLLHRGPEWALQDARLVVVSPVPGGSSTGSGIQLDGTLKPRNSSAAPVSLPASPCTASPLTPPAVVTVVFSSTVGSLCSLPPLGFCSRCSFPLQRPPSWNTSFLLFHSQFTC